MIRAPPIIRSASWADVEDENPPSPPRKPLSAPTVPSSSLESDSSHDNVVIKKIESRGSNNNQGFSQPRRIQQQPRRSSTNAKHEPTHVAYSAVVHNGSPDEPHKLWEPAKSSRPGSTAKDGTEMWRRGETLPPVDKPRHNKKQAGTDRDKKQAGTDGEKKSQAKPRSAKPKTPSIVYELCLEPVPSTLSEEDVKAAFGAEAIKRVKLVKEKMFVHFKDKEALDRALKLKLPRWGDKDVSSSIPAPRIKPTTTKGETKKQTPASDVVKAVPATDVKKTRETAVKTAKDQALRKKKTEAESKKTNVFAALDSSSEEDDAEEEEGEGEGEEEEDDE